MSKRLRAVDFASLSRPLPKLSCPRRPVNVHELLGVAGSEGIADLTLAYFLDPPYPGRSYKEGRPER